MAKGEEKGKASEVIVVGGVGALVGALIATLLAAKPAKAAPPDEKIDYLVECQAAIVQLLGQLAEGNQTVIGLLQQLVAAAGVPITPPTEGIEVTVLTRWVAKEPEEIFSRAILTIGTFYSDKMVDWRQGKRIYLFVESTLNQDVEIQVIGNMTDSKEGATDINVTHTCTKNDNISIGPAWDDWCPYIGVKITTAVAPTAGVLTISAVIQE